MATTPLLPLLRPSSDEIASLANTIHQYIEMSKWTQILQVLLISLAWIFDAQQTFISVFADASPSWHCVGDGNCSSSSDRCSLPDSAWSWDKPAYRSSVSDWGLDCYSSSMAGLPASAFFAGCLVGGLVLGTLADSILGRKKMLYIACLGMSIAALLTPLSPNIWVYAIFRFIAGFFRSTILASSLVLATELVSRQWKGWVGSVGFVFFAVGFLSLPAIEYYVGDMSWRYLYVWTSGPSLIYSLVFGLCAYESPRWLVVRGRKEKVIQTPHDMCVASNGIPVFDEVMVGGGAGLFSAMKLLFSRPWSRKRLAAVMSASIGIGLVYYGMPLAVGDLGVDLYMSISLNALAELPSAIFTGVAAARMNRKNSLITLTLVSGVLSGTCVLLSDGTGGDLRLWGRMGAELGSFFAASTALNLIMVYTLELFPTCVRNSALSMVRQALVLGGALAPQLVAVGRGRVSSGTGMVPFGVFGFLIASLGLVIMFLPETRGEGICDTMEEQEHQAALHENQQTAAAALGTASDGDDN